MGRAVLAEMSRVSDAFSYSAESESNRKSSVKSLFSRRRFATTRRETGAFLVEVMGRNCGLTERVLYFSWKLFAMKSI